MQRTSDRKYIIFVKGGCPYCQLAVQLLESKNIPHDLIKFEGEEQDFVLEQIKKAYKWGTVPIVLCAEEGALQLIGGYTDLAKIFDDGSK